MHLTTNEDDAALATDEEPSVIVQLSSRVQDGTRCRIGSLDMCIQGKCQVKSPYSINGLEKLQNEYIHCTMYIVHIQALCFASLNSITLK